MRLKGLLIGLVSLAYSCNGVLLSPAPTKPIKTRTQNGTVADGESDRVRQNSGNGTGNNGNPAQPAQNQDTGELLLDCFDDEIFTSDAFVVDGHTELFEENGNPSSICTLLTSAQKDTAVIQYLPANCNDCEQTIQNTWWAIQRSGYDQQFLHVLALPTASAALAAQIQEYIDEASIPAVIIVDATSELADQLQAFQQYAEPPQYYAINSYLEVDFIPGDDDQYLDIVAKAENALLSVDAGAEELPRTPDTDWDGLAPLTTGLIDIHSVTEVNSNAGAQNAL
ncbi:MAG: hypothetical protein HRU09_15725 [Oligoflexales bacterium]|nr:hypothetical protein [Oligoflexales bacterium]